MRCKQYWCFFTVCTWHVSTTVVHHLWPHFPLYWWGLNRILFLFYLRKMETLLTQQTQMIKWPQNLETAKLLRHDSWKRKCFVAKNQLHPKDEEKRLKNCQDRFQHDYSWALFKSWRIKTGPVISWTQRDFYGWMKSETLDGLNWWTCVCITKGHHFNQGTNRL